VTYRTASGPHRRVLRGNVGSSDHHFGAGHQIEQADSERGLRHTKLEINRGNRRAVRRT
jgi:hypothetical protein